MHQTRAETSKQIPIPRKGTKYVARPLRNLKNSIPVVVAVRDILKLARTTAEVKKMINSKQLKINGREVKDCRNSIVLFNLFHADKLYVLALTENGRFTLEETKDKDRLCKVINKKLVEKNKLQINLHDGTNILTADKKIKVNDSVFLSPENKISKHIPLEDSKNCVIISGKYTGKHAKILDVKDKVKVMIDKTEAELEKRSVVAK